MNKDILIGLALIGLGAILFFNRKKESRYNIPGPLPGNTSKINPVYSPGLVQPKTPGTPYVPINMPDVTPINPRVENETEPQYTGWVLPKAGEPYREILTNISMVYSLPLNLLARVAYQESHFRPDIINGETKSSKGAVGIMQIIPRWHPNVDPLDPYDSIRYAGKYLRQLFNKLGSWNLALAAYNWGIGNLQNKGFSNAPLETKNYVSEILSDIGSYRKIG